MPKLVFVVVLSACTGGFSLNGGTHASGGANAGGGGGGGASSPTASDTTIQGSSSSPKGFDINRDCFGEDSRIAWHRDPILRWNCFDYAEMPDTAEYSDWAKNCDELNKELGAPSIACKIDHKSFDAHYAAEAKKPRNNDRDSSDPGNYCSRVMSEFSGRTAGLPNTFAMMKKKPATKKELLAKVKQITCAYDDERGGTVELQGKNLVFFMKTQLDGGFILASIRQTKQFPELEKFIAEYGVCQGGFSC
jgi:hypothetical protein